MIKVLIVDDDQMNCDLLQNVLTRHGCHVISTTNGQEGLDLFRAHNPRVTLLDLRMPEMDGLTVLRKSGSRPSCAGDYPGGGATEIQENARAYEPRILSEKDCRWTSVSLSLTLTVTCAVDDHTAPLGNGNAVEQIDETVLVVDDEALLVRPLWSGFSLCAGIGRLASKWRRGSADSRRDASRCDRARPDHAWNARVEVLRALRERNYSGGVIIMTGSHNEELLGEAWSLGPQEILIKPVDLERLLTAIQLVLVCREC